MPERGVLRVPVSIEQYGCVLSLEAVSYRDPLPGMLRRNQAQCPGIARSSYAKKAIGETFVMRNVLNIRLNIPDLYIKAHLSNSRGVSAGFRVANLQFSNVTAEKFLCRRAKKI